MFAGSAGTQWEYYRHVMLLLLLPFLLQLHYSFDKNLTFKVWTSVQVSILLLPRALKKIDLLFCLHFIFFFWYRSTSLRWWLTPKFFFLWAFAGLEYQSSAQGRVKSSDSGGIYNSTSHEPRRVSSQVIGDGLTALPPGRALMSAAFLASHDMVAEVTGVGWVSIRHRIPAKPASSHRAISKNLPLCANNSTDVLAFWRSFASPKPALFVRCPGSQPSLAFPLPRERRSWNQPRYCHSPWKVWVTEDSQVSGSDEAGNVEDVDKQFSKPIILHKAHWDWWKGKYGAGKWRWERKIRRFVFDKACRIEEFERMRVGETRS